MLHILYISNRAQSHLLDEVQNTTSPQFMVGGVIHARLAVRFALIWVRTDLFPL